MSGHGRDGNYDSKLAGCSRRLEIARVLIDRPDILCSLRQNGRLILYLVRSDDECDYDEGKQSERIILSLFIH